MSSTDSLAYNSRAFARSRYHRTLWNKKKSAKKAAEKTVANAEILDFIPPELWLYIFSFIDTHQEPRLAQVCTHWYNLLRHKRNLRGEVRWITPIPRTIKEAVSVQWIDAVKIYFDTLTCDKLSCENEIGKTLASTKNLKIIQIFYDNIHKINEWFGETITTTIFSTIVTQAASIDEVSIIEWAIEKKINIPLNICIPKCFQHKAYAALQKLLSCGMLIRKKQQIYDLGIYRLLDGKITPDWIKMMEMIFVFYPKVQVLKEIVCVASADDHLDVLDWVKGYISTDLIHFVFNAKDIVWNRCRYCVALWWCENGFATMLDIKNILDYHTFRTCDLFGKRLAKHEGRSCCKYY
jgi:hypothetical protein